MSDRTTWFSLDRSNLAAADQQHLGKGIVVKTDVSPYDIPHRVICEFAAQHFVLSFQYLEGSEATKPSEISPGVLLYEGINSGRLYKLDVNVSHALQRQELSARLAKVIESLKQKAATVSTRAGQRAEISARLLDSVQDRALTELVR